MKNHQKRLHTQLICDIGEISGLFTDSSSLSTFLQKIVEMIAAHMQADVCSIYLYEQQARQLILKATVGLNRDFIEKLTLKLGEGLTGKALKELRPICERNASKNPHFRYFPGLGEEKFESFLTVPIIRGTTMIGALVIQNSKKNSFSDDDIRIMRAISSQLANTIEMTQLILSVRKKPVKTKERKTPLREKMLRGKIGSPGYAKAPLVYYRANQRLELNSKLIKAHPATLDDFHAAVRETEIELEDLQENIEEKLSDVASLIFTAQILMLKDDAFIQEIETKIKDGLHPAEAVIRGVNYYAAQFERLENPVLKEKSQDVKDIGRRLLDRLLGGSDDPDGFENHIVVAKELLPSDALKLSSQKVSGIVMLNGGVTSHVSILAQSLNLPLLIVHDTRLLHLPEKTMLLIDGEQGNLYIRPDQNVVKTFELKERNRAAFYSQRGKLKGRTRTKDGEEIFLHANINLLSDIENAKAFKAHGVGLYRTEIPFMVRSDFPSEEEQYVIYKNLCGKFSFGDVTFRTLDIGGDKLLSYFEDHVREENPYLGMRSIRFSLRHIDIFLRQLRAIVRAGEGSRLRIMFPMISSVDEFLEARQLVFQAIDSCRKDKIPCHTEPEIGMMVEMPSVVEIIDELADAADFFSIGTNDFIQYMLAVDRSNDRVSDLYLPHHPSVLRALRKISDAGLRNKIDVSVCGDMANDPDYARFLIGIGIRKLSLMPMYIPTLQQSIASYTIDEAKTYADRLCGESRIDEMSRLVKVKA